MLLRFQHMFPHSLQGLLDRNESLFYKVLLDNFVDMAPIVYTPTVGWACINHHKLYRWIHTCNIK